MKALPDHGERALRGLASRLVPAGGGSILRSPLFLKYVALFVAVVTVALLANAAFGVYFSYREQKAALVHIQREQAESAAGKIGQFVSQIQSQLGWTVQLPWSAGTLEQHRFDALRLLRQVPAITELAEIDATGHEQLRVSRLAMDVVGSGRDFAKEPAFTKAVADKVYYGPVYFRRGSEPYMTLSLAGTRREAGVSIAQVNLRFMWEVISKIKFSGHGRAYVVDAAGRLIAHPDISLVLRNTDMSQLTQVKSARANAAGNSGEAAEEATDIEGRKVLTASAVVAPLGWFVFVETPLAEALAPLYASIERTAFVLLGALALAFAAGMFLARRMVVPIQTLRAGAARIGAGDLDQRIAIKTGDEVEALADQFNDMAGRLRESYADLEKKVELRTHELSESLEQQTATSDVLKVISRSTFDLQTVLSTLVESAARLCLADQAALFLREGDVYRLATTYAFSGDLAQGLAQRPLRVDRTSMTGRVALAGKAVHVHDVLADPEYRAADFQQAFGYRTNLGVPLLRDGMTIGVFALVRNEVDPFTDKQIELVTTFADQAVIAIENARLLTEQRTALERQTASAEILRTIASTPGDAERALRQIAETTERLFGASSVSIRIADGDTWSQAIHVGSGADRIAAAVPTAMIRVSGRNLPGTVVRENRQIDIPDLDNLDPAIADWPGLPHARAGGTRTMAGTPLRREGRAIGALIVHRGRIAPFTADELALQQSFADQAVIAIENARLLSELREALEQQTATSEVLQVISSSPGELRPVFESILANATRLCEANFGVLPLREGDAFRTVAMHNAPPAFAELRQREPVIRPGLLVSIAASKQVLHAVDITEQQFYKQGDPDLVAFVELTAARTILAVPMLKDDEMIGAIVVYRTEARAFADKQIALVQNFAAQAVIAIENARLLGELRESLEQQTATAEVLGVINSSRGDLQPVFEAMVEKARQLCQADAGHLALPVGGDYRSVAVAAMSPEMKELIQSRSYAPGRGTAIGRALAERRPVQISDIGADSEHVGQQAARKGFIRTILGVPLLREGEAIGAFGLSRQRVEPFSDRQIDLVRTFADQAVIAIENVRLFEAEQQRTKELTESLEQQTAISEILRVISDSPSDVQPVLDAVAENAARICEAQFVDIVIVDDGRLRFSASVGALARPASAESFTLDPSSVMGRSIIDQEPVHIDDLQEAGEEFALGREGARRYGHRSTLAVPLVREGRALGTIMVRRTEVRPFEQKHIALLQTFADQAAIAMENVRLFNAEQQRTRELAESLAGQTATSEILRVISQSPTDARPVFDSIVLTAARLLRCDLVFVHLRDGATFSSVAAASPEGPIPDPGLTNLPVDRNINFPSRAILDKEMLHVPDWSRADLPEFERNIHQMFGANSALYLPLLREGECIGLLTLVGKRPNMFGSAEIARAESFRDQALIAMENARLFNETKEALERQTATSEVLRVISSSTGDLNPVFQSMLENATRLCGATFGALTLSHGDAFRIGAVYNMPPAFVARFTQERVFRPGPLAPLSRAAATKDIVHIADLTEDVAYKEHDPPVVALADHAAVRAMLVVPMLKDGGLVGALSIYRHEVRPFGEKQIELVRNFAAQAVIAIENTRLLRELRESLQQQTATTEVLKVISSSPGELQPVFNSVLENATRICEANFGVLSLSEGDAFRVMGMYNAPAAFAELRRREPIFTPSGHIGVLIAQAIATRRAVQVADIASQDDPLSRTFSATTKARSIIIVPMTKEDLAVGIFTVYRKEVRPFTDKHVELLTNFAAQAVIAIENARLLTELRQRTDDLGRSVGELRALGEVSQAVNSTLDLETVLETIVAKAVQLSNTDAGAIYVFAEAAREFRLRATYGMDGELVETLKNARVGFAERNIALMLTEREPVQVADLAQEASSDVDRIVVRAGYRSRLTAPLFRGEDIVGLLVVRRRTPGAFPQNTVDLIKTFAAQSAVAIQNARLFENVEARTRDLANSLQDLRTAQDRLIQTEKLASLGQLTAGIAHEIKNPLNFVNNFSALSADLIDELQDILRDAPVKPEQRAEVTELTEMLRGNLDKVVAHGKRADSIVKNMLLHSRQGSGEHQPTDINALVEESLNLAYHGARAEKQGFNITMEKSLDPEAGTVELFPQEITRVLLNLVTNGFYAATKRKAQGGGGDYEPTLKAVTKNLGDRVEIRIRDNGTGIPPEVKEKMFNPFFTTKPAGEGTGLGLSLSYDIIVKQHSGSIDVDTQPGEFTEFRIVLPRVGATASKPGGNA